MGKITDLTGQRFGRWLVTGRGKDKLYGNGTKAITWHCVCDCGNEADVNSKNLRSGKSVSCGCMRRETCSKRMSKINTIHGGAHTRLFRIWTGIKTRCFDENDRAYHNYGGRGITMCDEWRNDFTAFRDWALANGYSDDLTCDRIDNDKGYCPENCRWITRGEQQKNTRRNKYLTFNGETRCVSEWGEITGIGKDKILNRLNLGWTIERALSTTGDARRSSERRRENG